MDFKWIAKGLVESIFVVASILLALAVDQWAQDQEYEDLADQSLATFEQEILQNQARLEDAAPYHRGIERLLMQMLELPEERMDVRPVLEGLEPPVLLSTAWATSLATGVLTHMEFEVVSALSLTYSIQDGFESRTSISRPRYSAPELLSTGMAREQLDEALEYVTSLTRAEDELLAVYQTALEMIHDRLGHTEVLSTPPSWEGGPEPGGND